MRSIVGLVLLQILGFSLVLDLLFLICRLVCLLTKHFRKHDAISTGIEKFIKLYRSALIPIFIVVPLNVWGYFNLQNLNKTEYTVESQKLHNDYKVLFMSDFHWGTIQKNSVFEEKIEEINKENADFIILGGDVVEEGTSKEEMKEIFALCSKLKSRYGTFFIFGNHDPQQYSRNKTYTMEDLRSEIQKNGIKILEDEKYLINSDLVLIGRKDYGFRNETGRKPMKEFVDNSSGFILVADHQPRGKEENAESKVDLQLSGHTHAGQIFPIGRIMNLFSYTYGEYEYKNLKTIVSSGIAGWGYKVRTERLCEYVVVNLKTM